MFSYTKSLVAVVLALAAVIGAGLWCQARVSALRELTARRNALQLQMAGNLSYPGVIASCEQRLKKEDGDIKALTRKFVGRDYESPNFIKAVVKSASAAGMEMTDASKQDPKTDVIPVRGQNQKASVITHEIALKGSYTGLVKFMQSLNAWDMGYRLDSLEIEPLHADANNSELEIKIGISVFSLESVDSI